MAKELFPKGIIKILDNSGNERLAEYIARQKGFECCICGKGDNCYTFNVFDSVDEYNNGIYETIGFGKDHIKNVKVLPYNNV